MQNSKWNIWRNELGRQSYSEEDALKILKSGASYSEDLVQQLKVIRDEKTLVFERPFPKEFTSELLVFPSTPPLKVIYEI
jgi:hypothetical protein